MKNKFLKGAMASLILAVSGLANAGLITIDFESLSIDNASNNELVSPYLEDGFLIEGAKLKYYGTSHAYFAGSTGVSYFFHYGKTVLTQSSSQLFNLLSIDLSFLDKTGSDTPVTFIGVLSDNSTVSQAFVPLSLGFTTFRFNSSFVNLKSVSWINGSEISNGHQFDNIVLNNLVDVPEPSTLTIFALGIMGLVSRRFKKKS